MKKSFILLCACSFLFSISPCFARDISGVYDGKPATITITKAKEAYKIKCVPADGKFTFFYTSAIKQDYEENINDMPHHCSTVESVPTKSMYNISFRSKIKEKCASLTEETIGELSDNGETLTFGRSGAELMFHLAKPALGMDMAMLRSDCGAFSEDYPKKK